MSVNLDADLSHRHVSVEWRDVRNELLGPGSTHQNFSCKPEKARDSARYCVRDMDNGGPFVNLTSCQEACRGMVASGGGYTYTSDRVIDYPNGVNQSLRRGVDIYTIPSAQRTGDGRNIVSGRVPVAIDPNSVPIGQTPALLTQNYQGRNADRRTAGQQTQANRIAYNAFRDHNYTRLRLNPNQPEIYYSTANKEKYEELARDQTTAANAAAAAAAIAQAQAEGQAAAAAAAAEEAAVRAQAEEAVAAEAAEAAAAQAQAAALAAAAEAAAAQARADAEAEEAAAAQAQAEAAAQAQAEEAAQAQAAEAAAAEAEAAAEEAAAAQAQAEADAQARAEAAAAAQAQADAAAAVAAEAAADQRLQRRIRRETIAAAAEARRNAAAAEAVRVADAAAEAARVQAEIAEAARVQAEAVRAQARARAEAAANAAARARAISPVIRLMGSYDEGVVGRTKTIYTSWEMGDGINHVYKFIVAFTMRGDQLDITINVYENGIYPMGDRMRYYTGGTRPADYRCNCGTETAIVQFLDTLHADGIVGDVKTLATDVFVQRFRATGMGALISEYMSAKRAANMGMSTGYTISELNTVEQNNALAHNTLCRRP